MSSSQRFADRLTLLRLGGHPLGLDAAHATQLTDALRGGEGVGEALTRAGRGGPLSRCLELARPGDALGVSERLLTPMAEALNAGRALKTALTAPALVLVSVLVSALVMRVFSLPALEVIAQSTGGSVDGARFTATLVGTSALLALLLALAFFELPFSPFAGLRRASQRVLVLEAAAALTEAQVPLHQALLGAAAFAQDRGLARAVRSTAQALEAGQRGAGGLLLNQTESGLLASAAHRGVSGPVLWALARQAQLSARRELAWQLQLVQLVTLGLAGAAVTALGVSWMVTYSELLSRGG